MAHSQGHYRLAARQMALVFGISPDAPFPAELRARLQAQNAFDARVWREPEDTPACRILELELLYSDEGDDLSV